MGTWPCSCCTPRHASRRGWMRENEETDMNKILTGALLAAALMLGACGSTPTTVNDAASQAGTAVADPTTSAAVNEAATAVLEPTTAAAIGDAANQAGTAIADPTN